MERRWEYWKGGGNIREEVEIGGRRWGYEGGRDVLVKMVM